jgi:hypothetical protein
MIAIDQHLVDAAVLTGVAYYGPDGSLSFQSKQLRVANQVDPQKWGSKDGLYNTWVDKYANAEKYGLSRTCVVEADSEQSFFKYPYYEDKVLQWAEEVKQPMGILENLSTGSINFTSPEFEGPVLVSPLLTGNAHC